MLMESTNAVSNVSYDIEFFFLFFLGWSFERDEVMVVDDDPNKLGMLTERW